MNNHYDMLAEIKTDSCKCWHFKVKIFRIHPFGIDGSGPHWSYILVDEAGTRMEMIIYNHYLDRFDGLEEHEGEWVEIYKVEVRKNSPCYEPTKAGFKLIAYRDTNIRLIKPLTNLHYLEFKSIHEIPHMTHKETNFPIDIMGVVFDPEYVVEDSIFGPRQKMQFYIRDNIESQIKCVARGGQAIRFRDALQNMTGRGEVIVVLKMWKVTRHFGFFVRDCETYLETEGGLSDFMFNPPLPEVEAFRQSLLNSDPYVRRHGPIAPA